MILAWHQTSDRFYPGINNVKPRTVLGVLDLLREWGFSFWRGDHFEPDRVTDRTAVITFDDGYQDNYRLLTRLCGEHITPIVFIPTAYVGRQNVWEYSSRLFPARHLIVDEINRLVDCGVIVGSHGVSHMSLDGMTRVRLRRELHDSKAELEEIIGRTVDLISYPFGRFTPAVNEAAQICGYRHAFAADPEECQAGGSGFVLPRIPIHAADDYFSLKAKMGRPGRIERLKSRIIRRLAGGSIIRLRALN